MQEGKKQRHFRGNVLLVVNTATSLPAYCGGKSHTKHASLHAPKCAYTLRQGLPRSAISATVCILANRHEAPSKSPLTCLVDACLDTGKSNLSVCGVHKPGCRVWECGLVGAGNHVLGAGPAG